MCAGQNPMGLLDREYMRRDYGYKRSRGDRPPAKRPKSRLTQKYYNLKRWVFRRKHPYSKLRLDELVINLGLVIGLSIILLIILSYSDTLNSIAIWFVELGTVIALILLYFIIKNLYKVFVNLRHGVKVISIVLLILLSWQVYQNQDDFDSFDSPLTDNYFNISSIGETTSKAIEEIFPETEPAHIKIGTIEKQIGDIEKLIFIETPTERKEECKDAFNDINKLRSDYGRKELKWDDRAYELAVDRAKDMDKRNYFDHVTPEGTCAKDMKSLYGFESLEILAENCGGMTHYSDGNPIPETSVNEAVDSWMNSRGHRYNLLYEDHKSGAIGCYKSICVFYGVHFNQHGLGAGSCTSGEEGLAFWNSARKQHDEI
jgi:uncharacterized protein YkwD